MVGVNCHEESAPSPLLGSPGGAGVAILTRDPAAEAAQVASVRAWRAARNEGAARAALDALRRGVARGENVMPLSIAAAKAGVTTGEWGAALREVLGEFRAPTGVSCGGSRGARTRRMEAVRAKVRALGDRLGRNVKVLIGKPGLDGHSNGAEQIALRARDAGFEVVYQGIRVTAAQLVQSAIEEGVHLVGLSVLSGSHNELVPEVLDALRSGGPRQGPRRRRRHHSRSRTRAPSRRGASRACTRPRTSLSGQSWTTSRRLCGAPMDSLSSEIERSRRLHRSRRAGGRAGRGRPRA